MKPVIVFDFDGSLTECPLVWEVVIREFKRLGYRVICVTQRVATEEYETEIDEWMESHGVSLPTYFTGGGSKLALLEKLGTTKYIAIEDDMRAAVNGK